MFTLEGYFDAKFRGRDHSGGFATGDKFIVIIRRHWFGGGYSLTPCDKKTLDEHDDYTVGYPSLAFLVKDWDLRSFVGSDVSFGGLNSGGAM